MADRGVRGVPSAPKRVESSEDRPTPPGPVSQSPIVIPNIAWSSAPPPIAPRSFSTAPPPTPSTGSGSQRFIPVRAPAPPPPIAIADDEESTHQWVDQVRRSEEIRNQARQLVQDAMGEALAPLHYAVRDIERRLDELERRAQQAPPAVPPAVPTRRQIAAPPQPAPPQYVVAPVPIAPSSGALPRVDTSYDYSDVPFDGRRRQRRVIIFFAFLIVLVFGGMLVAMIASRTSAGP